MRLQIWILRNLIYDALMASTEDAKRCDARTVYTALSRFRARAASGRARRLPRFGVETFFLKSGTHINRHGCAKPPFHLTND